MEGGVEGENEGGESERQRGSEREREGKTGRGRKRKGTYRDSERGALILGITRGSVSWCVWGLFLLNTHQMFLESPTHLCTHNSLGTAGIPKCKPL